jgi:hypothetical protein
MRQKWIGLYILTKSSGHPVCLYKQKEVETKSLDALWARIPCGGHWRFCRNGRFGTTVAAGRMRENGQNKIMLLITL